MLTYFVHYNNIFLNKIEIKKVSFSKGGYALVTFENIERYL